MKEGENPTLQDLLERDKEKIAASKRKRVDSTVDPEDELLAEFGLYFGWDAVWAVKTNQIDGPTMMSLTLGARKVYNAKRYNKVIDLSIAYGASQSKKGHEGLKKHLEGLKKS